MKTYTFRARSIVHGTVSVNAETVEEAMALRKRLHQSDCVEFNAEMGSGETFIDVEAVEEEDALDGNHYYTTPLENAYANAEALAEAEAEEYE